MYMTYLSSGRSIKGQAYNGLFVWKKYYSEAFRACSRKDCITWRKRFHKLVMALLASHRQQKPP